MPETSNLPVNINYAPVISTTLGTRCPHCGQEFSDEGLNIAVFLYGIFFLVGKEIGYAGITCPKCLHTICHRDSKEAIVTVKKMISGMICLGNCSFLSPATILFIHQRFANGYTPDRCIKHPLFRTRSDW